MEFGKILLIIGVICLILGALTVYTPLFRLPGDLFVKKGNFTFSFPMVSSLVISIILTILVNLFFRR